MCVLLVAHNGKDGEAAVNRIRAQLPRPIVDWAEANSRKVPLIGDLLLALAVSPKHEGYVVFFVYTTLVGLPVRGIRRAAGAVPSSPLARS